MDYKDWNLKVVKVLENRPFLNWKTRKNDKLSKRLFKEGYTPESAAGLIILNS